MCECNCLCKCCREKIKAEIAIKYTHSLILYNERKVDHNYIRLKLMCVELKHLGIYSPRTSECDIVRSVSGQLNRKIN